MRDTDTACSNVKTDTDVAIIGAGFSGLGMAIQCKKAGRDFRVFEASAHIGGTWRENTYPGCACDVPAHLYSFSFALNPQWSRLYATQPEIRAYLEKCADDFDLRDRITTHASVTRCEFDEQDGLWRVFVDGVAKPTIARYIAFATGPLSQPGFPAIDGIDRFRGESFHTAKWNHNVDFSGKRVAVIGTGASAIQVVPEIAKTAKRLTVFQRTPPWILPKDDRVIDADEKANFARSLWAQRLFRWRIYWRMELRALAFTVWPKLMNMVVKMGEEHIASQVADPALRAAVTPDYLPGCKRILMSNEWYRTLAKKNVELVTDSIDEIREHTIAVDDGRDLDFDVVVYATGFRVADVLGRTEIRGLGGRSLNEAWQQRLSAYLGTTVAGFPNLFLLLGPNTGLGHNSVVFMAEAQIHYALAAMRALEMRGARYLDVRSSSQIRFNQRLVGRLANTVWAAGCKSWYLDASGHNFSAWPGSTAEYWLRTRQLAHHHYRFVGRRRPLSVIERFSHAAHARGVTSGEGSR